MKYIFSAGFVVGMFIFLAMPVFAKSPVASEQRPVMVKGMHFKDEAEKMEFMHGMMRASPSLMVATSDGGVIVLIGGKLKKFDKDLNLVKEVVVDSGLSMLKPMNCPMMKELGGAESQKKVVSGNTKNHKK